jgi:tetratricopeptide (TPR) repeat protein
MNHKQKVEFIYAEMLKALVLKRQGDRTGAIAIMDGLLSQELDPELRSEVIGFRAVLREDLGDCQNAKEDFLLALSLSQMGSYPRYTLELTLGGLSERLGIPDEAVSWYIKALLTVAENEGISGGTALKSFLKIKGDSAITDQEQVLCNHVVEKSWKLLWLPGGPDLSNLKEAAETLLQAEGRRQKE